MIYLGLTLDFFISQTLPINSYFFVANLDKNKLPSIIISSILLDIIFHKFTYNLLITLFLYILIKLVNHFKKYEYIKNLFLYILYFNITYLLFGYSSNYLISFFTGLILQFIYLVLLRKVFIN